MQTISTVIVDKETGSRRELQKILRDEPDIKIVGERSNGQDAIVCIRENNPDLLFLDIDIPEMNGFEVLKKVKTSILPYVVIVTTHEQYALRAFDYFAIDYLLKPVDHVRLGRTLQRIRRLIYRDEKNGALENVDMPSFSNGRQSYPERFMIKLHDKIIFIKIDEIDWIESAGNYVRLHIGKENYLIRETMNNVEYKLDPEKFVRIHRSSIVNIDRIQELQTLFNGEYCVTLDTGEKLTLGKKYRDQFKSMFV